jgi:hypothetical protein
MSKRACLVVAVAAVMGVSGATLAPAHVQRHKTTVNMHFGPNPPGGTFYVDLESGNHLCEPSRTVKLFKDGAQIDHGQTDRSGEVLFSVDPPLIGDYQAKALQKRLPRSLQHRPGRRHRRICRAGAGPTVTLP